MQISRPLSGLQLSSQQPASPKEGVPSFAGKDKEKGAQASSSSPPNQPAGSNTAIPWIDQVFSQPFFLNSRGGVPFLHGLHDAITSPEANKKPKDKQTILNVFDTILKTDTAKLSESQSFPFADALLSGSPQQKQLAEKLGKAFKIALPDAQTRERAQDRLDRFTQIMPRRTGRLMSLERLSIEDLLAGAEPEQSMPKPTGFDPLSKEEQQALATLIETTPGLERNRVFQALRYLNRTSTTYNNGYTPLRVAVEYGYLPVVKALLKMPDVDVNAITEGPNGNSILMEAVSTGNARVVQALLEHPDIDVTGRAGFFNTNALEDARHAGHQEIIALLENHIQKSNITLSPRPEPQTPWERLLAGQSRNPEQDA